MSIQFQLRSDTSANWTAANTLLATGEPGYEIDSGKMKIGDGIKRWNALPYIGSGATSATASSTTRSFMVAASRNRFLYKDGESSWAFAESGDNIFTICKTIVFNEEDGMWVAGGVGNYRLAYSFDGKNWAGSNSGNSCFHEACHQIIRLKDRWLAGGKGGYAIGYSFDGITWTGSLGWDNNSMKFCWGLARAGGVIVAAGNGPKYLLQSVDSGVSWQTCNIPEVTPSGAMIYEAISIACNSEPKWIAVLPGGPSGFITSLYDINSYTLTSKDPSNPNTPWEFNSISMRMNDNNGLQTYPPRSIYESVLPSFAVRPGDSSSVGYTNSSWARLPYYATQSGMMAAFNDTVPREYGEELPNPGALTRSEMRFTKLETFGTTWIATGYYSFNCFWAERISNNNNNRRVRIIVYPFDSFYPIGHISRDNGLTWTRFLNTTSFQLFNPTQPELSTDGYFTDFTTDGNNIIASNTHPTIGISYSKDGGLTWSQTSGDGVLTVPSPSLNTIEYGTITTNVTTKFLVSKTQTVKNNRQNGPFSFGKVDIDTSVNGIYKVLLTRDNPSDGYISADIVVSNNIARVVNYTQSSFVTQYGLRIVNPSNYIEMNPNSGEENNYPWKCLLQQIV